MRTLNASHVAVHSDDWRLVWIIVPSLFVLGFVLGVALYQARAEAVRAERVLHGYLFNEAWERCRTHVGCYEEAQKSADEAIKLIKAGKW